MLVHEVQCWFVVCFQGKGFDSSWLGSRALVQGLLQLLRHLLHADVTQHKRCELSAVLLQVVVDELVSEVDGIQGQQRPPWDAPISFTQWH